MPGGSTEKSTSPKSRYLTVPADAPRSIDVVVDSEIQSQHEILADLDVRAESGGDESETAEPPANASILSEVRKW